MDNVSKDLQSYKEAMVKKKILDKRERIMNMTGGRNVLPSLNTIKQFKKAKLVKFDENVSEIDSISCSEDSGNNVVHL